MAQDQTSRGVTVSAREWRIFKWAPKKSTFHPNCCVAEKISCLHITHMRRCEILSAPCIWANSEFLEAPKCNSIFNLKVTLWWERPPGRDKLDRGQEAVPTEEIHLVSNY